MEHPERLVNREDVHAMAAGSLLSIAVATVLGVAIPPTLTVERQVVDCDGCPLPDVRLVWLVLGFILGSFALGWWAWRRLIEKPKASRPSRPFRNLRELAAYSAVYFAAYLVMNALIHAIADRVRLPGGYYGAAGSPVDVFVVAPASIAFLYILVVALGWPTWVAAGFVLRILRARIASAAAGSAGAADVVATLPRDIPKP